MKSLNFQENWKNYITAKNLKTHGDEAKACKVASAENSLTEIEDGEELLMGVDAAKVLNAYRTNVSEYLNDNMV